PTRLRAFDARLAHDFPADSERYVVDAEGYAAVIVNGEVLLENGQPTGALPGRVLRGGGSGLTGHSWEFRVWDHALAPERSTLGAECRCVQSQTPTSVPLDCRLSTVDYNHEVRSLLRDPRRPPLGRAQRMARLQEHARAGRVRRSDGLARLLDRRASLPG